jgi:hypothetical protein
MVTYGALIWAQDIQKNPRVLSLLNKLSKKVALRVCRGYRTVSYAAATMLASAHPIDILAEKLEEAYKEYRELKILGNFISGKKQVSDKR